MIYVLILQSTEPLEHNKKGNIFEASDPDKAVIFVNLLLIC